MTGRHRKPTTSSVSVAKIAFTGAVLGGSGIAMAGIATALTLEPQLIKHWREGRDPNPQLKPIDWKRKPLASLAILAVVRYQMHRLSRGHQPKANVAPCMALVRDQWFIARRTRQYRAAMTQSSQ